MVLHRIPRSSREPGEADSSPRLELLGQWRLTGVPCGSTVSVQPRRLLAILGLRGAMSRSEVRGVLWPSLPEADAAARLRTALWLLAPLRSLLVSEDREAISLDQSVGVDVPDMLQAAAAVDDGETRSPDLFAADLLPTWDEEWLMMERERLRQVRLHALEQLSRRFAEAEDYGPALDAALLCLHADPLRESAHRAVIRVHLAEGNVAAAVAQYDRCRAVLESELGLPPTRQLTELMAAGGWRPPAAMQEADESGPVTPEGMASRPVRR